MASCKGHICKLIVYKLTKIVVQGLPAAPAAGSGARCTPLADSAVHRRLIADLIKKKVESTPDSVEGHGCPDGCTCVQAGPAQFGPPAPTEWTATIVITRGRGARRLQCKYKVKGTYDKAAAVVDGRCTDGKDDLGEVEHTAFDWGEDDDPVASRT